MSQYLNIRTLRMKFRIKSDFEDSPQILPSCVYNRYLLPEVLGRNCWYVIDHQLNFKMCWFTFLISSYLLYCQSESWFQLHPIWWFLGENICHYQCDRSILRTDGSRVGRKRRYQFSHRSSWQQSSYFGKRLLSFDKLHPPTSSASALISPDVRHPTRLPGLYPVLNVHCLPHNSATGFRSFHCARPTSHLPAFLWLRSPSIIGDWLDWTRGPGSFRLRTGKLTTNWCLPATWMFNSKFMWEILWVPQDM